MCEGKRFARVIDFGKHPLVNSLVSKEDLDKTEPVFQLTLRQCRDCYLVQITSIIDSQEIYKNVDYLYFSSDMPNLDKYFRKYAKELMGLINPGDFVVEIGANDGLMLNFFRKKNMVLGVDPASNVVVRALRRAIPVLSEFFSERLSNSIKREYGKAKLIYGNNCIAHLNDLNGLMRGVTNLLDEDGIFAVECNYWGAMIQNHNYSLIYHDHFSYFSLETWIDFARKHKMNVFDAYVTPAQGGSLRVFMDRGKNKLTDRFKQLLRQEQDWKINSLAMTARYNHWIRTEAKQLLEIIEGIKKKGKTIAGYGCAAKGLSVLKFAGIDQRHIDYFVDDSPAKQGKYTPVTHIPVISREEADSTLPDYFFITAPNYENDIIKKEQLFKENGGKFITVKGEIK